MTGEETLLMTVTDMESNFKDCCGDLIKVMQKLHFISLTSSEVRKWSANSDTKAKAKIIINKSFDLYSKICDIQEQLERELINDTSN